MGCSDMASQCKDDCLKYSKNFELTSQCNDSPKEIYQKCTHENNNE